MAHKNKLTVTKRTEFGKGAARRLRRAGEVPAVVYGHGIDPLHIALPGKEAFLLLRHANVLIELTIEGQAKPITVLPKQISRDPITKFLEHVDLLIIREGEKVTVEVPLVFVGEAARDGLVNTDVTVLPVLAPALSIPESIEVSIEGMQVGDHLLVSGLTLPEGVEPQLEAETLVVGVVPQPTVQLDTPEETADGAATDADGAGAAASGEDSGAAAE